MNKLDPNAPALVRELAFGDLFSPKPAHSSIKKS